ncbi:MAG TPA: sigma-70 family RNA polymerase sigma factor [Armatimonadota bacterium]|nr:sigma-70 family RNA polymerase sigma factor [Armatimonadota bacterium]
MTIAASARTDEAALIDEVRRGDTRAVTEFYHRYLDRVFNFVYHRVGGSVEDAEDVTQDTFISAFRSIHHFRGDAAIFTWLCGIAKNKVRDFIRQRHRAKDIPREQMVDMEDQDALETAMSDVWQRSLADDVVDQDMARSVVRELFARLSDDEREALWLRYVEELSVKEIAQVLGRTPKGIEGLLTRAKKKAAAGEDEVEL